MDSQLIRDAKILAAKEGTSISALLTKRLEQIVREKNAYDHARDRALSRLRKGLNLNWKAPISRSELHER